MRLSSLIICGLRYTSSTELEPQWEWWPAATKKYSAREGYRWLLKKTSNWNANSNLNWLWNTNIPEKFKFTMWLGLHDALPTETFRFKRHLASSDMCKRYSTAGIALEEWFRKALANNDASFGAGLWWTTRLLPWPELPPRTYRFTEIETMPLGFSEIACVGNHRCELFAAWRGLVLAWDCGLMDIICETDCLDILPIMHELTSWYSSEVTDLVHKIRELLSRPWLVHVEWVSREANRATDWMAKYGAKSNSNHVIWSEPCVDLQQIIRSDLG
ncbi:uncharacterized protein LOC110280598 [Arachis duranensis]|uniref:Uncharacterized protein LOC110280598 n=1 Tax=Arachis duranensis TaxID=130453 RepID=A0A6P5NKY8_ARADU|nr:uncharacterized protein LOC110280598 [Arachis duranensis]